MELGISGAAVSIALPDIVLRKVKKKLVFFPPVYVTLYKKLNFHRNYVTRHFVSFTATIL